MNRRSSRIFAVLAAIVFSMTLFVPTDAMAVGEVGELIPGGMAFGVKFFTDGAIVIGTTGVETAAGVVSPAKDAGLMSGDIIIRAGGSEFDSASELTELIAGSGGQPIIIAYTRSGEERTATVTPAREVESGEYRIGIFIKDSTAGIGTVTFIDPNTRDFGGLGHGIYDGETGILLPMSRGAVVDVEITGVTKSEPNLPGGLHGDFGSALRGELWQNSDEGVFGRLSKAPSGEAIPVGKKSELTVGKAHILTTLSGSTVEEYEIEIEQIFDASGTTKNFLIRVTDERLLERAGGIVQGMSGSPIIKDGKLVGAVTHVLVNDPVHGYGIFIENMLDSAFSADTLQSAA